MSEAIAEHSISLPDELKERTAEAHRNAEARPMQKQLASAEIAPEVLASYLTELYFVHEALESLLDEHPSRKSSIGFNDAHCHSARLRDDLRTFDVDVDSKEPLDATREFIATMRTSAAQQPASILGVFYVLEGSMNGNRFIAKALNGRLGVGESLPHRFSYFDPYGQEQRACWQQFRDALSNVAMSESERTAVLEAADRTFARIADISDAVVAKHA